MEIRYNAEKDETFVWDGWQRIFDGTEDECIAFVERYEAQCRGDRQNTADIDDE